MCIRDRALGCVDGEVCLQVNIAIADAGSGVATATLIKTDDLVLFGVEKARVFQWGTATGATVDKHGRLTVGVSRKCVVDVLAIANVEVAFFVGLGEFVHTSNYMHLLGAV